VKQFVVIVIELCGADDGVTTRGQSVDRATPSFEAGNAAKIAFFRDERDGVRCECCA
jgi:hypothetical protein